MPCYLFTYHAYGTWMPDRKQGYVQRKQGILSSDAKMATRYRLAMKQDVVEFTNEIQLSIIDSVVGSQVKQQFRIYFISTDTTHVHVLVSWRDTRPWLRLRSTLKGSMSRYLKREIARRDWFVEGGSRKRVKDQKHFDYLIAKYLPRHSSWKWCPEKGKYR